MKKTLTAAALIGALTFIGIQTVSAHGGRYFGNSTYGQGFCGNYYNGSREYTAEDQAALGKFKAETTGIRREIVVKRSELNALLRRENPDETKIATLTGELYDLQTERDKKAKTAEIDTPYGYQHGSGMMQGYGWGRHMMDW